jgi:anion exchange protein
MKKIPAGAESANVLVGEVDFLDHQFSAFIRLNKSCVLGDFTEVPVPTRFLFIILGPKGNINKYHEIGRSISTLMSDDLYHEVAYKAQERDELLKAFDQFLDQVTVLPPGEWDPNIRLDPPKKVPTQEERLEQLQNGSINKSDDDIHPHETDPGLEFTGRFCGGLIDDIKRKSPWYLSDFKDALSFQCLSSVLFMYFACLSPIITFGGLLGTATEFNMSALESLVSGALSGILYGLFSGQPMTILGSTGPVLVFETILFNFSKENGIDYIGLRAWVGLWTMVILITIVITDCSALVKYITRFTEESFASLIAIIFIKESIFKLLKVSEKYRTSSDPLDYYVDREKNPNCMRCILLNFNQSEMSFNVTDGIEFFGEKQCQQLGANYEFRRDCAFEPDVFYFSVFLYIFTFLFAMCLKSFRNSPFLPSTFRYKVSDFNIVIVILSAVLLDSYCGYNTPKLDVPLKFETTIPTRGWFINPITRNPDKPWLALLAIIPALLATILIFMDQHITAVIVNRRENKLKKGGGYHLDLLMVAITIGINSVLGLPWMVAATVLSINHVLSLKKETESSAPGEKPRFLGVIEQRVTNTLVFVLIGCSIFLSNLLRVSSIFVFINS